MRLMNKIARRLKRQEGQLLIEVLIALAILGIVVVAFLSGLATASRAIIIADERTTAESLTRTQLEYVKSQAYNSTAPEAAYDKITGTPGYYIYGLNKDGYNNYPDMIDYTHVNESNIIGVAWDATNGKISGVETGIQIVTVIIYHEGKVNAEGNLIPVLTTTDYKVNR